MTHIELLEEHRACSPALEFASGYPDLAAAIAGCDNIEWLRWALRLIADPQARVGIAAYIVRYTPIGGGRTVYNRLTDDRSRRALDVCDRYAVGDATKEELMAARIAAFAASSPYYASAAAYYAHYATAAAYYASCASTGAHYAGAAAYYAVPASYASTWQSDYIKSLDWSAITENT